MPNLHPLAPRIAFVLVMMPAVLVLSVISGNGTSGQDVVTDDNDGVEAPVDAGADDESPTTPGLSINVDEFAQSGGDIAALGAEATADSTTADSAATGDAAVAEGDGSGSTTTVDPASNSGSDGGSSGSDPGPDDGGEGSEGENPRPGNSTGPTAGSSAGTGSTGGTAAGTSSTVPRTTTTSPSTTANDTVRDGTRSPLRWPYPADSIWNHPLGAGADLVPLNMVIPREKTLNVEEDILVFSPKATKRSIYKTTAAWQDGVSRCGARTSEVLVSNVPIPGGFITDPDFHGRKPNHSAAIVMPDYTLFETQPLHVCTDGTVVSQFAAKAWRGDSILTGGQGGSSGGAHGGSGMSAFGGTIRLGEWVPGGTIPHAVKIEINAAENLSRSNGGYRWPALNADKYAQSRYGGSVGAARMGALLALPQSFDVNQLSSEPARILARTLKGYGAYVVDDTAWSAAAIAVEWSPEGRVSDEFARVWGFRLDGHRSKSNGSQAAFLGDMETIYRNLHVVNDNRPGNIGGAGSRVAPWAPPFSDGTGGR